MKYSKVFSEGWAAFAPNIEAAMQQGKILRHGGYQPVEAVVAGLSHRRSQPWGGRTLAPDLKASVVILMCTRNGEAFLEEQLASLVAQTHRNWHLIVSDDASVDATVALLRRFAVQGPGERVGIRTRDRPVGAAANFMMLLADPALTGDYFSCCDQDDVWRPGKLERAIAMLEAVGNGVPAVYFSRTRNVDAGGRPIGCSPLFRKPPGFRNALVQSIGGGNTMVCNAAARALLVAAGPVHVASHDWWTYLLVSGAGGSVYFDPEPSLDYRQHGANQIGANRGVWATLRRLRMVANGRLAVWLDLHAAALEHCSHLLTPQNRDLLVAFRAMRSRPLLGRLAGWNTVRPYRQTLAGQAALLAALFANKI